MRHDQHPLWRGSGTGIKCQRQLDTHGQPNRSDSSRVPASFRPPVLRTDAALRRAHRRLGPAPRRAPERQHCLRDYSPSRFAGNRIHAGSDLVPRLASTGASCDGLRPGELLPAVPATAETVRASPVLPHPPIGAGSLRRPGSVKGCRKPPSGALDGFRAAQTMAGAGGGGIPSLGREAAAEALTFEYRAPPSGVAAVARCVGLRAWTASAPPWPEGPKSGGRPRRATEGPDLARPTARPSPAPTTDRRYRARALSHAARPAGDRRAERALEDVRKVLTASSA
jgi:hypothetical protein